MSHILIPVDFSAHSKNALDYGIAFARAIKGTVTLLHTVHYPANDPLAPVYDRSGGVLEESQEEKAARESLEELEKNIKQELGNEVQVDHVVPMGFPGDEILKVVKEKEVDFVVMGTKGKGEDDYADSLMGTTSRNVLQKAPCSVLLVPQQARSKKVEKICYASDHHEGNGEALERLVALADRLGAEVHSLHVLEDPVEGVSKDKLARHLFQKGALKDKVQLHTEHLNKGEALEDRIEAFITSHQMDLLAMLNQNRNFFQRLFDPSFSRKMAFHTKVPLLVFHRKEE